MPGPPDSISFKRYDLVLGENTFASAGSKDNAGSARKLQSLIPSLSGQLDREQTNPTLVGPLPSNIKAFWQFNHNNGGGSFTRFLFAATSTTLYKLVSGAWVSILLTPFANTPVFVNIDNSMHLSDGVFAYLFDGTNFIRDGLQIPINPPPITVTAGTGSPLIQVNRYYWTSYGDQTATRSAHESSSSPISVGTGPVNVTGGQIVVKQEPGTVAYTTGSAVIVGTGTNFSQRHVGMTIRTPDHILVVASVQDATHLTMNANSGATASGQSYTIAPQRATHWNIYASASEEDKVGLFLAQVPLGNLPANFSYTDTSPMVGTTGSIFQNIQRPLINDPPNATTIMEVHKRRIWRRDEGFPNFFTFTAYEEVLSTLSGNPYECVPGIDPNTVSPSNLNEDSYPDQSFRLRCMRSHADALYIGTDSNVIPLYGESIDDFTLSQVQSFSLGMAGLSSSLSTPFGLVFLSYDRKLYLFPSQGIAATNQTTSLIELSRPKRYLFEQIDGTKLNEVQVVFYNWGRRTWLVINLPLKGGTYQTWAFDFETRGWFQLQRGVTALFVYEPTEGVKVLIGAGTDNVTYVLDDMTGTYAPSGNYPAGTYRQLIDFGDPDTDYVVGRIEYEKSDVTMDVVVNAWLDPLDPDNPGNPIPVAMSQKRIGSGAREQSASNRYSGQLRKDSGAVCQRILIELQVPASAVNASIRGLAVYATKQGDIGR